MAPRITVAPRDKPLVYLTFDDGPDPEFTPRILDLLDFFQVRATFFVLGRSCVRLPNLLKRICDDGHAVGNHTFNHRHPWLISARCAREEVRAGYRAITDICATPPRVFRPPYGRRRKAMLNEAHRLGMETVLWSRSAIDWGGMASATSIGRRLSKIEAGDVVLCHDAALVKNHPEMTLEVLPAFIDYCHRRQLRFAGLDELAIEPARQRSISAAQSV